MVPGGDAVDAIMYHKQHASGSTVGDGTVGGSHESDASHEESLCDQGGGQGMALDFAALLQQAQHVHLPPPQEVGTLCCCTAVVFFPQTEHHLHHHPHSTVDRLGGAPHILWCVA